MCLRVKCFEPFLSVFCISKSTETSFPIFTTLLRITSSWTVPMPGWPVLLLWQDKDLNLHGLVSRQSYNVLRIQPKLGAPREVVFSLKQHQIQSHYDFKPRCCYEIVMFQKHALVAGDSNLPWNTPSIRCWPTLHAFDHYQVVRNAVLLHRFRQLLTSAFRFTISSTCVSARKFMYIFAALFHLELQVLSHTQKRVAKLGMSAATRCALCSNTVCVVQQWIACICFAALVTAERLPASLAGKLSLFISRRSKHAWRWAWMASSDRRWSAQSECNECELILYFHALPGNLAVATTQRFHVMPHLRTAWAMLLGSHTSPGCLCHWKTRTSSLLLRINALLHHKADSNSRI